MERKYFTARLKEYFESILKLNETKGNDYSGNNDVFANFKRNAERLGMDKYQVWAVYFFKHMDSIETWLKERTLKSEPIEGRIDDAIMYLLLLKGMLEEDTDEIKKFERGEHLVPEEFRQNMLQRIKGQ